MARFDLDLFVIGAGSGGVRAARIAAGHGARVAVAEEYRVGGTCVIRGCVPKKLFVLASRFADAFADAAGFGWSVPEPSFSWPDLVAAKDREIARLEGIYAANLEKAGVAIHAQRAEIEDAHTVRLGDGSRITAGRLLIATGGHPVRPHLPGAERAITSNEVFHLERLPERMVVVGGGFIAVEFACLLQRLGVAVTLVYRGELILRGFDHELRRHLADAMAAAGVEILCGTDVTAIEDGPAGHRVALTSGAVLDAGVVMFATGRRPNTAGLGVERVGVMLDAAGAVVVDAASKTTAETVWAVGDVTNRINLTPVAIREGHAFADTVFGGKPWTADHVGVPSAVFATPELGTVGLTEEQARASHGAVDIYKTSFRAMKATLSGSGERVFMKLVVDARTDRVLGVHILGEGAAEMAQLLAISVKMGATKADLDATMPLHPTAAEELVTLRTKQ
ncbi:glutathione-disulfide reductase [Labrys wisconsinensis]|uniref:Glutathione reductase n=1 Tax=Labrys wisconsinensis TaxID=425677 RepID=A0ABU0JBY6_9HYPH|nr:glutathione-disulfide reductase [Labrys wisconsinensis]MDQ0470923.1 glutathione reductase (NADPH) [Labrys wisconsinensis]